MTKFTEVKHTDGGSMYFDVAQITLITIPSRFAPNYNGVGIVMFGATRIDLPVQVCEKLVAAGNESVDKGSVFQ